jgi:two-component system, NarL family, response regulator LiaR
VRQVNVIRIVIAEDHPVVRDGIRETLQREPDMEVVGDAGTGTAAVVMCGSLGPDIVLMDLAMPELNGLDAAKHIRNRYPSVKIVMLSAYDDDAFVAEALKIGASSFISKSKSSAEIVDAIRGAYHDHADPPPIASVSVPKPTRDALALTPREREILELSAQGFTSKEIAETARISERTVHTHFRNIFAKLDAVSRTDAVVKAARKGWIQLQ